MNRIGIAGDIILTLKEQYQKSEFSMIDPSHMEEVVINIQKSLT